MTGVGLFNWRNHHQMVAKMHSNPARHLIHSNADAGLDNGTARADIDEQDAQ